MRLGKAIYSAEVAAQRAREKTRKVLRRSLLRKYNYTCQVPDCDRTYTRESQLDVHHIDHDNSNWALENLTIVCHPCNMRLMNNHYAALRRLRRLILGTRKYRDQQAKFDFAK